MDKVILIIPMVIVIGSTFILKMVDVIYKHLLNKSKKECFQSKLNLMSSQVSYKQFMKVAKESLRVNSPVRKQDDFLDFLIEHISSNPENIANKILLMNYGEQDEE